MVFDNNRKGQAAWIWVYGLVFIFALGILYTIFLYVFEGHLVPAIQTVVNSTITDQATITEINTGIDKYMIYFKLMPYILFFIVIIYMVATTIYKQSGGQYQ